MFKYLLLGFVLMLSGLEVTAQDKYHAQICIDGAYSEQDFDTISEPDTDWFTLYVESNQHENFRVYIWYEGEVVDGWQLGECEFGSLITPEETAQQELKMITWVHEAAQRGLFDEVFGRGGE